MVNQICSDLYSIIQKVKYALLLFCMNIMKMIQYTGHTPQHSLASTVFSFDGSKVKSSSLLKLTDKTNALLFFCFDPLGNVIPSLFLFCSVAESKYVRFLCHCEESIVNILRKICDKLWTKVRTKRGLLSLKMCCIRPVAVKVSPEGEKDKKYNGQFIWKQVPAVALHN